MNTKSELLDNLQELKSKMYQANIDFSHLIETVNIDYKHSASNLIDYLVFRSENLQSIQESLHYYGLSSLASSESHIKSQIENVLSLLGDINSNANTTGFIEGTNQLIQNTKSLFGDNLKKDTPFIMVTLDANLATNYKNIISLLKNGMNIARINCAHDNENIWLKIIKNIKKASIKTNKPCKIYMDLAGPKIRTVILGKYAKKGKMKIELGEEILYIEDTEIANDNQKIIGCTLPNIVKNIKKGKRILFDDGLIEAIVTLKKGNTALLKITRISCKKHYIKSEKGMNFPDTVFNISPLTEYDLKCLPFILENANMVGFSFINRSLDIEELQKKLVSLNKPLFPIIAKIETNEAVNNLPFIILQGMQKGPFGVMIARGDLAVEIGFERLSEVQEEILWICEAAHIPVIWATQVLENLNKQGLATRSEITDAARSALAECVMINKGDFTLDVLKTLIDILKRSRQHNNKQRHIFRELNIAKRFFIKE